MTLPPQDILISSSERVGEWLMDDQKRPFLLIVAEAVKEERERCARLCEEHVMGTPFGGTEATHGRYVADLAIDGFHQGTGYAALIRGTPPKQKEITG